MRTQNKIQIDMGMRIDVNSILDLIYEEENGEIADRLDMEKAVIGGTCSCIVAKTGGKLIGFMTYRTSPKKTVIIDRLLVRAEYRRQEIGRSIIGPVLRNPHYKSIEMMVSERNLIGQLFLRACGFKCKQQIKAYIEGCDDSGYLFAYERKGNE